MVSCFMICGQICENQGRHLSYTADKTKSCGLWQVDVVKQQRITNVFKLTNEADSKCGKEFGACRENEYDLI